MWCWRKQHAGSASSRGSGEKALTLSGGERGTGARPEAMAETRDELVSEVAEWTWDQAEGGGDEWPRLRELPEHGADGVGAGEDALLRSAGGVDGED